MLKKVTDESDPKSNDKLIGRDSIEGILFQKEEKQFMNTGTSDPNSNTSTEDPFRKNV